MGRFSWTERKANTVQKKMKIKKNVMEKHENKRITENYKLQILSEKSRREERGRKKSWRTTLGLIRGHCHET